MNKQGPTRTCVGCGASSSKEELVRFVRNPDKSVSLDESGNAPGRGAYLCCNDACLHIARKKGSLHRALRVQINDSDKERLMEEFKTLCVSHSDVR